MYVTLVIGDYLGPQHMPAAYGAGLSTGLLKHGLAPTPARTMNIPCVWLPLLWDLCCHSISVLLDRDGLIALCTEEVYGSTVCGRVVLLIKSANSKYSHSMILVGAGKMAYVNSVMKGRERARGAGSSARYPSIYMRWDKGKTVFSIYLPEG